MSADLRQRLRQARPLELPVEVCLDGQLVAEHHELRRAYERAAEGPRERLTDGGDAARLGERLRDLEARIRAATVNVRLRSLGKGWDDLVERHPPREGNEQDETLRYNSATLFDELLLLSMATMVPADDLDAEPVELTDEDRQMLLAVMPRQKYDEAVATALSLNIRQVKIPFWSAASEPTPPSSPE